MQIVIDIDEEQYKFIKQNMTMDKVKDYHALLFDICKRIANGTPLPKGHGDLKDMGNLQYIFDLTREGPIYSGKDIERAIKSMKSIIEADKAESEDEK